MKVLEQDMLLFCKDMNLLPLVFLRKIKAGGSLTGFETMKAIHLQIFSLNAKPQHKRRAKAVKCMLSDKEQED